MTSQSIEIFKVFSHIKSGKDLDLDVDYPKSAIRNPCHITSVSKQKPKEGTTLSHPLKHNATTL